MATATTNIDALQNGWSYSNEYRLFYKDEKDLDIFAQWMKKSEEIRDGNYEPTPLPDTRPTIPDALIRQWAEKYDVENMTQEEYQAFIDDLISAGVLEQSDKSYVRYDPNLVAVGSVFDTIGSPFYTAQKGYFTMQPVTANIDNGSYHSLTQAGGNARLWAEGWKAAFGDADSYTSDFVRRQLSLFDEISWILGRMAEVE